MLVYDIEIIKAIPNKDGSRMDGIEYCEGWGDHRNMGVSVIGAYDTQQQRSRVFCEDNVAAFIEAAEAADLLVSFNGLAFDNAVIAAAWDIQLPGAKCYDLLVEAWVADGKGPLFKYPSHIGYGLDALCQQTFGVCKTGSGALAPVLWQRGERGQVIDYCLNDVWLTNRLLQHVIAGLSVAGPNGPLKLRKPA